MRVITYDNSGSNNVYFFGTRYSTDFYFQHASASGTVTTMHLDGSGNVTVPGTVTANSASFAQPIIVGTPTAANDAATKSYVDSAIAGGSGSSVGYWTLSGSNLYPSGSYNVGLGGQTSPVYNLDIGTTAGTVNIRGSGGQLYVNNISSNTGGTVYINSGNNLNVGGTLTTGGTVTVGNSGSGGPFNNGSLLCFGSGTCPTNAGGTDIQENWGLNISGTASQPVKINSTSLLVGYTSGSGSSFPVGNLLVSGNVGIGIGVTTPGTTLDVNGNINVGSVLYDRANTNYYINPSGNIMPYAANLGGGINVGGNITIGNPYGIITGSNTGILHHTYTQTQTGWSNSASTNTFWIKLMTVTVGPGSGYSGLKMYGTVFGSDDAQNGLEKLYLGFNQSPGNSNITNVSRIQEFNSNKISDLRVVRTSSNTDPTSVAVTYDVYILLGSPWLNNYNIKWEWDTDGLYSVAFTNNQTEVTTAPTGYAYQDEMADNFNFVNGTINAAGLKTTGTMYSVEVDNGTATGATTINWASSNTQTLVLGASPIALTFTNGQPGAHYTLALKQDATGSRLVTWPGNVRWSSGVAPTLTTTANKTDYVEFVYDGLSSTFDGVGFNANF